MPEFVGGIKYPVPGDAYNSAYGEPQWWKDLAETAAAQIATKADAGHSHSWAQITGKPSTFAPSAHQHPWSDITDRPAAYPPAAHTHSALSNGTFSVDLSSAGAFALRSGSSNTVQWNASNGNLVAGNVPWARVTDKPTSFPSAWGDVSGKPSTYPPETHTHSGLNNGAFTWSITSAGAIAANAGGSNTWQIDANTGRLIAGDVPWARVSGTPATYPPASHTHAQTDIVGLNDRLLSLDRDTGWRKVAPEGDWTGDIYIRRTGRRIKVIFNGISTTTTTRLALITGAGFIADTPAGVSERFLLHNTSSATRRGYISTDAVSIADFAAGEALYGSAEWVTANGWPAALPGDPA